jgi:formylglycine-generating enzyme required for sulfatase activity
VPGRTRSQAWAVTAALAGTIVVSMAATAVAVMLQTSPMVKIPEGDYMPFFQESPGKGKARVVPGPSRLAAFRLDAFPVTNAQFLEFVREHPEWRRSRVKPLFADNRYLANWRSDLELPDKDLGSAPVTNVSWFAAEAYCEARGLKLPTTDQWEFTLSDQGRKQDEVESRSLEWFATPNPARLRAVGGGEPNGYGVYDMVGLVWEWTLDSSSFMTGTEQRNTSSKDDAAFCGSGSIGVSDATNYPAFMRYAMRSSLKPNYAVENVGFRCEGDE